MFKFFRIIFNSLSLYKTLRSLVTLKINKEHFGKTEVYKKRQPELWEDAKRLMLKIDNEDSCYYNLADKSSVVIDQSNAKSSKNIVGLVINKK